jgi:L-fuconolactonase
MRIDSHQHFWRYEPAGYPWIQPSMAALRRDYLPADLEPVLANAGIDGSIVVQAQQTVDETRWLLDLAAQSACVCGVVGWVPLVRPDVDRTVEELARNTALKGVRHILHDEPDDRYMLRDDFNRGVACLVRHDLVYDVLVFARHLPTTLALVDRHPRQRFVVDHIAKPTISAARFDHDWARNVRALAERPHVACKLSGVVTEVRDTTWTPDTLKPYVETAIEAFGAERMLFGTDWPVCLLRCGYADWVTIALDFIGSLSASEQQAIMGKNAARIYHLAADTHSG